MKISEIIQQPEGRRLEFKEKVPLASDIAKTIIAFANDAGGELYIGIKDTPRQIIGIDEEELFRIEEQISNIIADSCSPIIIPDISLHVIEDKSCIKVKVYRGNNFPYFLKSKGKNNGTIIRVGSTNRFADEDIIAELERQKRHISFDGEIVYLKKAEEISFKAFSAFYEEKFNEPFELQTLIKLGLVRKANENLWPTNTGILFSNDNLRQELFPYAKIECARFKGDAPDIFIDQKTIDSNISLQVEDAYDFVLKHINKGAYVEGVYTKSKWEYPVKAIREVLRNAVVHRDYSMLGKDVKLAIYDDMIEITSPGKLMPSIDFSDIESRQSDIRNKVIAPVFKKLGIIDQWGNGLKLIAVEVEKYKNIEFKWSDKGLVFQVQFIKKNSYIKPKAESRVEALEESRIELKAESRAYSRAESKAETALGEGLKSVSTSRVELKAESKKKAESTLKAESLEVFILRIISSEPCSKSQISKQLNLKTVSGNLNRTIKKLLDDGYLEQTIPDKPSSRLQRYKLSPKGQASLK